MITKLNDYVIRHDYRLFAFAFANGVENEEDPKNWQYNPKNPTDRVWTRINPKNQHAANPSILNSM
jgi:hypothetical protein